MMCVVEINKKLENYLKDNDIGAIFESDVLVDVHVDDEDSNWFVLKITDKNSYCVLVTSEARKGSLFSIKPDQI